MTDSEIEVGKRYYANTSNEDTYVTIVKVTAKGSYDLRQGSSRKPRPFWVVHDEDRGRSVRIQTPRKFLSKVDES